MTFSLIGKTLNRLNPSSLLQSAFERSMASAGMPTNRLASEKSPYLLQHATNPVDWYPWGKEAFAAAKEQNKLIFLSVGYSTCHWCHVMERESFENPEIAKLMNENFINIKVDREERPDVDKVYMTFVTATSGQGGWPMSVFITPDLVPVAGGTYFPPKDRYRKPGFPTVLSALAEKWKSEEEKFKSSANSIITLLKKKSMLVSRCSDLPTEEVFAKAFSQLARMYEPDYGGFGDAPKFPQPSNFNFLFTYKALNPELDDAQRGVDMCLHSLKMMSRGGIHDHVGKGFSRYSTDKKWHVPHFEKMLYDQAQLVMAFLDAFLLTKEEEYRDVVRDIMTYVMRDLSHPLGGFYSAEDADSLPSASAERKLEGAFFVWSYEEVCDLLSAPVSEGKDTKRSQVFNFHYSVAEGGNLDPYQDPHDEMKGQNVLLAHDTVATTASEFELEEDECRRCLEECHRVLYEARMKRPRPHLDDKMLTAWNGMMLSATARAGAVLNDKSYVERAICNAQFMKKYLLKDGILLRSAYKGEDGQISLGSEINGFSDDYAWTVRGLCHLYEATLEDEWLRWAEELQDKQNELFWDDEAGGYFMSQKDDESILLKLKDDHDGAEPSVNSVTSGNLIRLARILNRPDYEEKATGIFKAFSNRLMTVPASLPEMANSFLLHTHPAEQIILAGDKSLPALQSMLHVVHNSRLNPNRTLLIADTHGDEATSFLHSRHKNLKNFSPKSKSPSEGEEASAYVCKDFTCSLPFKSSDLLREKIVNG